MTLWDMGSCAGPARCSHVVYAHGLAAHVHNCGVPAVLQNRAGGARSKRGRGGAERRGGGGGGARGLSAAAAGVCETHDGETGAAVAAHPGCVALPGLACVPMQQGQLGGESVPGRRYQSQLSNQRWCVCSNISGSAAGRSGLVILQLPYRLCFIAVALAAGLDSLPLYVHLCCAAADQIERLKDVPPPDFGSLRVRCPAPASLLTF